MSEEHSHKIRWNGGLQFGGLLAGGAHPEANGFVQVSTSGRDWHWSVDSWDRSRSTQGDAFLVLM